MPRIFDNIEENLLPALSETVESNEPQVICSLGLRHVSVKGAGDA